MSAPFFRVDRSTKRFGGLVAVNHVTFESQRDQIAGRIGPNRAGESTLRHLLTKILRKI